VRRAAAVSLYLGFLFHGPLLGRLGWKLADVQTLREMKKFSDMIPKLLKNLLANFVTASVLAVIYFCLTSSYLAVPNLEGRYRALWLWLGFLVTSTSIESSGWGEKWNCGF